MTTTPNTCAHAQSRCQGAAAMGPLFFPDRHYKAPEPLHHPTLLTASHVLSPSKGTWMEMKLECYNKCISGCFWVRVKRLVQNLEKTDRQNVEKRGCILFWVGYKVSCSVLEKSFSFCLLKGDFFQALKLQLKSQTFVQVIQSVCNHSKILLRTLTTKTSFQAQGSLCPKSILQCSWCRISRCNHGEEVVWLKYFIFYFCR